MPRRMIWRGAGLVGWVLCETAFRADCRGPLAVLYRWGCAAYEAESRLGQRWGFLMPNPLFGHDGEPALIEPP